MNKVKLTPEQLRNKVMREEMKPRQDKINSLLATLKPEDRIPGKPSQKRRKVDREIDQLQKTMKEIDTALNKRLEMMSAKKK